MIAMKNMWKSNIRTHGVVVITTAQVHSTKLELRFCVGSNPACGVWGSLTMVPAGNKAKLLSWVNHTTKTIHSTQEIYNMVIVVQGFN